MKKLFILIIALAWLLSACTHRVLVTYTQPHVVTRVDTVGKHVRYRIEPVGPPRSSIHNGLKPGDTLKVLHDYFIRY